ncbi:MAG: hypothetical protein WA268_25110, partial [Xanthobacteraceae bacterium]
MTSTRAIAARCRMPPDSSCGYLFSAPASFTNSDCPIGDFANARRRNAAFAGAVFHVLPQRQPGKQRVFLEHDAAIGART